MTPTTPKFPDHRLRNGAAAGQLVRVYREHQMRFAWAAEVNTGLGFGPNVLVHYLDGNQEQERVYGNVVQPVDETWLSEMKARLKGLEDALTLYQAPTWP
jgi:hypothetical protein